MGVEGASGIGILAIPATVAVAAAVVTHGVVSAIKGAVEAGDAGKDLYSQMKKAEGTRVERPPADKPPGSTTADGAGQKPPSGPEPAPASAETAPGKSPPGEKSAVPAQAAPRELSKEAQKGIRSLQKQIAEHEKKLADFKADPTVRPGMEGQPKEVIEAQQQSRIRHLEKEIQTFKENIKKLEGSN